VGGGCGGWGVGVGGGGGWGVGGDVFCNVGIVLTCTYLFIHTTEMAHFRIKPVHRKLRGSEEFRMR